MCACVRARVYGCALVRVAPPRRAAQRHTVETVERRSAVRQWSSAVGGVKTSPTYGEKTTFSRRKTHMDLLTFPPLLG